MASARKKVTGVIVSLVSRSLPRGSPIGLPGPRCLEGRDNARVSPLPPPSCRPTDQRPSDPATGFYWLEED